jgi:hypothetical protein
VSALTFERKSFTEKASSRRVVSIELRISVGERSAIRG